MNPVSPIPLRGSKGVTLFDLLIGLTVTSLVSTAVFTGLSQVMLFSGQDEISQNLKDDLYLTMGHVRRDCNLATNVVPKAGTHVTGATTLCLRLPLTDDQNDIVADEFQFVTYSTLGSGPYSSLIREIWATEDAASPTERSVLNDHIVTLGFLYGGKSISTLDNLTSIREVEIFLVSARETGLTARGSQRTDIGDYLDVSILNDLAEFGLDFSILRAYIDYMNMHKADVVVASSMGSATFRNKKSLGLKVVAPPLTAS